MLDPVTWKLANGEIIKGRRPGCNDYRGVLRLIDQTKLPVELTYLETADLETVYDAIKRLVVRGAPAIGCSAALGLAAVTFTSRAVDVSALKAEIRRDAARLASSRPTAVNLFWALDRCTRMADQSTAATVAELQQQLAETALDILSEDIGMCQSIGRHGVSLFRDGIGVLTHCNAGALATGDYGTALSPVYTAHEQGMKVTVYSDETRPLLQGSRLTAWELNQAGVDVVTICDNMAAQVMREGKVQLVIVGADRIAANGDTANKIGTYGVAILAKYHGVPFYVAAPYSTIDLQLADGSGIPIEQRDGNEIKNGFGRQTAPDAVRTYNPAFDVTPHELIAGIITERGIITPPFPEKIRALVASGESAQKR